MFCGSLNHVRHFSHCTTVSFVLVSNTIPTWLSDGGSLLAAIPTFLPGGGAQYVFQWHAMMIPAHTTQATDAQRLGTNHYGVYAARAANHGRNAKVCCSRDIVSCDLSSCHNHKRPVKCNVVPPHYTLRVSIVDDSWVRTSRSSKLLYTPFVCQRILVAEQVFLWSTFAVVDTGGPGHTIVGHLHGPFDTVRLNDRTQQMPRWSARST